LEKPNFNWTPKVDGVDDASAEDINLVAEMAQSGIDIGYEANKRLDELPETPTIDESNLVHKTDDEEISGNKKFTGKVDINRIETEAGIGIYGGDSGVYFGGNADSLFMRYGAEFSLDGDLKVNGKEVALKEDITTAIQEAILDSWAEVIEP
jgi:hypothetical protein